MSPPFLTGSLLHRAAAGGATSAALPHALCGTPGWGEQPGDPLSSQLGGAASIRPSTEVPALGSDAVDLALWEEKQCHGCLGTERTKHACPSNRGCQPAALEPDFSTAKSVWPFWPYQLF